MFHFKFKLMTIFENLRINFNMNISTKALVIRKELFKNKEDILKSYKVSQN